LVHHLVDARMSEELLLVFLFKKNEKWEIIS